MKKTSFAVLTVLIILLLTSCNKSSNKNEITVYCYDSFIGDWGPGNKIAQDFEKETGIHVNLVGCSGSVQLYSKIIYEGQQCKADAVIGLPDSVFIDNSLFEKWIPECKNNLIQYSGDFLIPFDYGVFSFVYDSENKTIQEPESLSDLTKPEYKDKFILIDPRTSSVGLGLLKWTYEVYGEKFANWWSSAVENSLTVADSWSSAYGLFTEGEAPLVISYTTSPVYHMIFEDSTRYKAVQFKEGHVKTEEYLAVLKQSQNKENAKKFCEYVLTKGQNQIAIANTMFPANLKTETDKVFKELINPDLIKTNDEFFIANTEEIISKWTESFISK